MKASYFPELHDDNNNTITSFGFEKSSHLVSMGSPKHTIQACITKHIIHTNNNIY